MPVFVMWAIGRGGPQPKTQFTKAPSAWLTIGLAAASAGVAMLSLLLWQGLPCTAWGRAGWPSEALDGDIIICWDAMRWGEGG